MDGILQIALGIVLALIAGPLASLAIVAISRRDSQYHTREYWESQCKD